MKLWIARRKSGNLYLFFSKPSLSENNRWFVFTNGNHCYVDFGIKIDANEYKEITFGNSPQEVELKLVDNGINN
jgi:hypothetical protein